MWQWITKIAAARLMDKLGSRDTLGSNIAMEALKASQSKPGSTPAESPKPPAPIWTGTPGAEAPPVAKPGESKTPSVPAKKPAGEPQSSFNIEKWAANPGGTAKQKLGEYVGKGVMDAYRNK